MRGDNDVRNGLALHNERASPLFFTTSISAFMESQEVSKFQAQFRGTRSGCRERKGFQGVTLPGVENMIPCVARARTHDSFFFTFQSNLYSGPAPAAMRLYYCRRRPIRANGFSPSPSEILHSHFDLRRNNRSSQITTTSGLQNAKQAESVRLTMPKMQQQYLNQRRHIELKF